MPKRRSAPAPWLLPSVALFVVVPVAFALCTARSEVVEDADEGFSREGSEVVDASPASSLTIGEEPLSYVITYRLERYEADRTQVSEETVVVRRPFDARVTTRIDGRTVATRTSSLGALTIGTGQGPRTLVSPPAPSTSDLRLKTSVPDGLADGHLQRRERRRVLGRECQVYRAGSTVIAGELVPVSSRPKEHSDFCVDSAGLLLEEVWTKGGRVIQQRVATSRRVDVDIDDATFEVSGAHPLTTEQGNGLFRPIEESSGFEGSSYRLQPGPPGFDFAGRFVVQPPRLDTSFGSPEERSDSPAQVSIVDAWTRGPDLITLAQTIVSDPTSVSPAGAATAPIDSGIEGLSASFTIDLRMNEIRVALPEGRLLRLSGTAAKADLRALVPTLRAEVGTGIRLTEG